MASTTIVFGLALVLLGLAGYLGTGTSSITALIPAVFGLMLVMLGFVARAEHARKHAMHAASAIGLIGTLLAIVGLVMTPPGVRPAAAIYAQVAMALLLGIFTILCVRSFIAARQARKAPQ